MDEMINKNADEITGTHATSCEDEITRLTRENEELKSRVEMLIRDRDQYRKWWTDGNMEKDRMLDLVKSLVNYAGLV